MTALPFPVVVLTKDAKIPPEGNCYIIGQNGIYLRKDTGIITATVKLEGISFLEKVEPQARLRLPMLPAEIIAQTLLFFRRVYKIYRSEAAVLVHYSTDENVFRLSCPQQMVSGASVHYDATERIEGYCFVGTIHSHASMAAYHSCIDENDEADCDGLHITIGCVDQPYFTVSSSVVVNDNRFLLDSEKAIVGLEKIEWRSKRNATYRRFVQRGEWPLYSELIIPWFEVLDNANSEFFPRARKIRKQFYNINLPDGKDYRNIGVPKLWMDCVKKKSEVKESIIRLFGMREGKSDVS